MTAVSMGAALAAQPAPPAPRRGPIPPNEVSIALERTVCYGTCPAYTVTIAGDGRITYQGKRFVAVVGPREDRVAMEKVAALLNEFLKARFFDARDVYDETEEIKLVDGAYVPMTLDITDVPSAVLTLKLGSRQKRVVLRFNYPVELRELAARVDELAQTTRWIKAPK
jgi:hypothetical protein